MIGSASHPERGPPVPLAATQYEGRGVFSENKSGCGAKVLGHLQFLSCAVAIWTAIREALVVHLVIPCSANKADFLYIMLKRH